MRDRGARLAGRGRVACFLRGLIGAERLVFRTRDIEDHRFDLSFRIVGAQPAIAAAARGLRRGRGCGDDLFGPTPDRRPV